MVGSRVGGIPEIVVEGAHDHAYLGRVDSISAGTGARFSRFVSQNQLGLVGAAGDILLFLRTPGTSADSVTLWQDGEQPVPNAHRIVFDRQLAFLGNALLSARVERGGLLPMDTYWRRVAATDSLFVLRLGAYDASGHAVFAHMRDLGYLLHPAGTWRDTTMMRERRRARTCSA